VAGSKKKRVHAAVERIARAELGAEATAGEFLRDCDLESLSEDLSNALGEDVSVRMLERLRDESVEDCGFGIS
jgi:hypothetical protein